MIEMEDIGPWTPMFDFIIFSKDNYYYFVRSCKCYIFGKGKSKPSLMPGLVIPKASLLHMVNAQWFMTGTGRRSQQTFVPLTIGGEKREKLSATWKTSVWVGVDVG